MSFKYLHKIKPLIPIILLVLFVCLLSLFIPKEALTLIVKRAGIFAPLVFIILNLLTFIFAPLSGTPVMAAGFYVFGSKVILLGFIVTILATITNFWISRLWGIGLVTKLAGKENMKKLNDFTKDYGLIALFVSRLFLRGFVDLISYAAGLTTIKFMPYLIVSILADIPGVILTFWLSSLSDNITQFTLLIVGSSYLLLIIYYWMKKRTKIKKG